MNKYIDAEKLKAEIERYKKEAAIARFDNAGENAEYFQGKVELCDDLTHIITSLQQEQPKFKVGDTIHKKGENTVFPMVIERISDGDYVCDNAHSFINIKYQDDYELVQQEQPKVDLDFQTFAQEMDSVFSLPKDMTENTEETPLNWEYAIARHFYKLGLKARKQQAAMLTKGIFSRNYRGRKAARPR